MTKIVEVAVARLATLGGEGDGPPDCGGGGGVGSGLGLVETVHVHDCMDVYVYRLLRA